MRLVLLETSGNQPFIFSTNKQGENVGGSELTHRAGTQFVLDAAQQEGGPALDGGNLRRDLTDRDVNRPIEQAGTKVEVIVATSGKAILAVDDEARGRRIISAVTRRALEEAPGLDICGAVSSQAIDAGIDAEGMDRAVSSIHLRRERVRSRLPGPESRFARLPVIDECATSGMPASFVDDLAPAGGRKERSIVAWKKRSVANDGLGRMRRIVQQHTREEAQQLDLFDNITKLEEEIEGLDWLAVIHSDGNGIGGIFLDFARCSGARDGREYLDKLRRFSIGLDMCTERAFVHALAQLDKRLPRPNDGKRRGRRKLPVVPLVLGGDDFTAVSAGRHGLRLTVDYLQEFERATGDPNGPESGIVREIAARAFGGSGRLASCAGVAIVKPHYPFHAAYELANDLIRSAKKAKDRVRQSGGGPGAYPSSALDFLVHHDSTGTDLRAIRDKLVVREGGGGAVHLLARPYLVTDRAILERERPAGLDWALRNHWDDLCERVNAINSRDDDGKPLLPSSMLHEMRAGLFHGRSAADAMLKLVYHRYEKQGLRDVVEKQDVGPSFFFTDSDGDCRTRFLDALDVSDFLE